MGDGVTLATSSAGPVDGRCREAPPGSTCLELPVTQGPLSEAFPDLPPAASQVASANTGAQADRRAAPDAAERAFAACLAALDAGHPAAGALLQDLLRRFPGHADGWDRLGRMLARRDKPEAALVCFRRAAAVAPSATLALACGRLLRLLGRFAEAGAALAEACRLDPACAPAHFLLGVMAQDAGDGAGAAGHYRRALAADATLAEAAVNLGTVLQDAGDLEAAKRAYGQAVRQSPDTFGRVAQALTTSRRGELWLDLGRLRRALAG